MALRPASAEIGPKVFPIVAILVIVLGFVRGTFSAASRASLTWLRRTASCGWWIAGDAGPLHRRTLDRSRLRGSVMLRLRRGGRLRAVSRIDLGIFFIVFTCMILMRFN